MTTETTASTPSETSPETSPEAGAAPSLWRNRDYQLLVWGNTASSIGARMSGLAFPLLTLWLTDSPLLVGVVGAAEILGLVVLGLPAAALVDRWNRRAVMVTSSLGAAAAYATVVVAYDAGLLTAVHLAVAGLAVGAAAALYSPADTAAVRTVVEARQLSTAMSVNQARMAGAGLVGPSLGGVLYAASRVLPVVVDVVTYLVAAGCAAMVRTPLPAPGSSSGERERLRTSIREGISFIWQHPALRPVFVTSSALNFAANGLVLSLIIVLQQRHVATPVIGLVEAVLAAGMLVGAMLSSRMLKQWRAGRILIVAGWVLTAAFVVVSLTTTTWLLLLALGIGALLIAPLNAGLMSYQVLVTPDELQGRVAGSAQTVAMGVTPLAPVVGGLLLEYAGQTTTLLFFTVLFAAAAVVPTCSRAIRGIPLLSEVEPA